MISTTQPSNEAKIKFLQGVCRRAGKQIKQLKNRIKELENKKVKRFGEDCD